MCQQLAATARSSIVSYPTDECPPAGWELRLQAQEEEVTLLKSALCDVLRRIRNLESQFSTGHFRDSSSSIVQPVSNVPAPAKVISEPVERAQDYSCVLCTVGTQTVWSLVDKDPKDGLDPVYGTVACENDSINGESADGNADSEEVEKVSQSPTQEEGAAIVRGVTPLRLNKKEL
ncbi:unnamed protein product [Ranitomeya imitator]|uniref:Uncharacterized protein n=1 Tax=Ranitomeya imitator TaxID=111125 RepID=A0ABN9M8D0_9NEOB|nr:unnamed protein product [Ranitomeya imitator]